MTATLAAVGAVEEKVSVGNDWGRSSLQPQSRGDHGLRRARKPGFRLMDRILHYDLLLKRNHLELSEPSFKIVEAIVGLRGLNQAWKADRVAELIDQLLLRSSISCSDSDAIASTLKFILLLRDYRGYELSISTLQTTQLIKIYQASDFRKNPRFVDFPTPVLNSKDYPQAVARLLNPPVKESDEGFVDDGSVPSRSLSGSFVRDHGRGMARLWRELIVAEKAHLRLHRAAVICRPVFLSQSSDEVFTQFFEANFLQNLKNIFPTDDKKIPTPAIGDTMKISFSCLKEELKFLISGVSTRHFAFDEKNLNIESIYKLYSVGASTELLKNILSIVFDNFSRLLFCRQMCANLRGASNVIAQTFGASLAGRLMEIELKLMVAVDEAGNWVELNQNFQPQFKMIRILHEIVLEINNTTKSTEAKLEINYSCIFDIICQKAIVCHHGRSRNLYLSLVIDLIEVYYRILDPWLALGVTTGRTSELVKWNPECVVKKDRRFWTNAYRLSPRAGPFESFVDDIVRCGVTMNLIRRCRQRPLSPIFESTNFCLSTKVNPQQKAPLDSADLIGQNLPIFRNLLAEPMKTGLLYLDYNCIASTSAGMCDKDGRVDAKETRIDYLSNKFDRFGLAKMEGLPIDVACNLVFEKWLSTRFRAANEAGLKLFLDDLKFGAYCSALKDIFLLGNGVFGYEICNRLCSLIAEGSPGEIAGLQDSVTSTVSRDVMTVPLPSPVLLNALLTDSIESIPALAKYSDLTSFTLKSVRSGSPGTIDVSSLGALKFVCLNFRVPWPLNVVLAEDILAQYQELFAFILSLNWILWALKDVYQLTNSHLTKGMTKVQSRQLHMYHFEMAHFVHVLHSYICHQLLDVCWSDFQQRLGDAGSVEDLYEIHNNFLRDGKKRCLLTDDVKYVQPSIQTILELILRFRLSIYKALASPPAPSWARVLQSARVRYDKFHAHVQFLISVLQKLECSGNRHLEDLLMRLNFNNHYSPLASQIGDSKSAKRRSVM